MRGQMRAQERELRMLQHAGILTASAELLLSRMRAKVDDLRRERAGPCVRIPQRIARDLEVGQSEPAAWA
jgi:hypothetical protein